jgi:hypothetical protein
MTLVAVGMLFCGHGPRTVRPEDACNRIRLPGATSSHRRMHSAMLSTLLRALPWRRLLQRPVKSGIMTARYCLLHDE